MEELAPICHNQEVEERLFILNLKKKIKNLKFLIHFHNSETGIVVYLEVWGKGKQDIFLLVFYFHVLSHVYVIPENKTYFKRYTAK